MPTLVESLLSRTTTHKSETVLQFAKRSLSEYSSMVLQAAGITDLLSLNRAFTRDPGFEVEVVERRFGGGVELKEAHLTNEERYKSGWLIFERTPAVEGGEVRARVFTSFEGAAAEFSVKLRLQKEGEVALKEVAAQPGTVQLTFTGPERAMVVAPLEALRAPVMITLG